MIENLSEDHLTIVAPNGSGERHSVYQALFTMQLYLGCKNQTSTRGQQRVNVFFVSLLPSTDLQNCYCPDMLTLHLGKVNQLMNPLSIFVPLQTTGEDESEAMSVNNRFSF